MTPNSRTSPIRLIDAMHAAARAGGVQDAHRPQPHHRRHNGNSSQE
jgi:hypothetical protein